jgi:hypothetical protein
VDFAKNPRFLGDLFDNQPGYRTSPLIIGAFSDAGFEKSSVEKEERI